MSVDAIYMLTALQSASRKLDISKDHGKNELTHTYLMEAIALTHCAHGILFEYHPDSSCVSCLAVSNKFFVDENANTAFKHLPVEQLGVLAEPIKRVMPLIIDNVELLNKDLEHISTLFIPLSNFMGLPILMGDDTVCILCLFNHPSGFTAVEQEAVKMLTEIFTLLSESFNRPTDELKLFFKTALDLLCVANFSGYFTRLSPSWSKILGWSDAELLTKPFIHFVHPDDIQKTLNAAKLIGQGENIVHFENRYQCKDTSYRWIEWNAFGYPSKQMIIAAARDISDRKQIELRLHDANKQVARYNGKLLQNNQELKTLHYISQTISENLAYETLIPKLVDTLVEALDFDGLIFYQYNPEANLLEGKASYGLSEPLQSASRILHPGNSIAFKCLQQEDMIYSTVQDYPHGPIRDALFNQEFTHIASTPLLFSHLKMGALTMLYKGNKSFNLDHKALYQSISNQIAIGIHHANLINELKVAKIEAELATKSKSEFLASVSHEIRTPLNAVIGFSDLLKKTSLDSVTSDYVNAIGLAGKNLLTLINDILDLSKIEAGHTSVHLKPTSIGGLFSEINQIFGLACQEKKIQLFVTLPNDFPEALMLDTQRLRQVLFNLIGNAVKFTHHGHITLSAEAQIVFNDERGIYYDLQFSVTDTGIGIRPSDQTQIFDAFTQQNGQDARRYGGTGLGLAICKKLTEIMGGVITFTSELDKGTTFNIFLTKIESAEPDGMSETHKKQSNAAESAFIPFAHHPVHILAVDDVPLNLDILKAMIAKTNARLTTCTNVPDALTLLTENRIDLILMDIVMPEIDGIKASHMIRKLDQYTHVPIIAITATVKSEDNNSFDDSVFNLVLSKPVSYQTLIGAITSLLMDPTKQSNSMFYFVVDSIPEYELVAFKKEIMPIVEKMLIVVRNKQVGALVETLSRYGYSWRNYDREAFNSLQIISDSLSSAMTQFDIKAIKSILMELYDYINVATHKGANQ